MLSLQRLVKGDFSFSTLQNTIEIPRLFPVCEYLGDYIEKQVEQHRSFIDLTKLMENKNKAYNRLR